MSTNINEALAVVFAPDGSYVACATTDQMLDAVDRIVAAGGVPNVFTRKGGPQVTHRITGTVHGSVTMAHTIHGGVRL
jgi:hypothetical protein